jgi:hypothetical protein
VQAGWSWFPAMENAVGGTSKMTVVPNYSGDVKLAMLYTRRLTTSELVGASRGMLKAVAADDF